MIQLTQEQKRKLITIYPELRQWFDIQELKERKPEDRALSESILVALVNKIQALKGDPGHSPVKGKDYFTPKEAQEFIDHILDKATPIKGVHYFDGEPGKDYVLTPKDKREIASKVEVPVVEKVVEKTEVVREVMPKSIDVSIVKGAVSKKELEEDRKGLLSGMVKMDGRIKLIDQRWHGGGLSQVYHDTTLSGLGTSSSPLKVVGGGGSGFQLPTAGSVNGANQTFTWATAPNAICVDGTVYAATSQDASATPIWTGTTTTVFNTLTPNQFCFAVA